MSSNKLGRNPFQARAKSAQAKASTSTAPINEPAKDLAASLSQTAHPESETHPESTRSHSQSRRASQPLTPAGQIAEGLSQMHPLLRWALVDVGADAYMTALKGVLLIGGALKR